MRSGYLASAFVVLVAAVAAPAANASAVISVYDLGTATNTSVPLLGSGVSITGVNNAPVVSGGGQNIGTIVPIGNTSISTSFSSVYSDGTVGWNPLGQGNTANWLSIGGAYGNSFGKSSTAFATFSLAAPQTSLQFV